jgi:hypothetical protein
MSEDIDPKRTAYIGLRHFSPDTVRRMRANLDCGTPARALRRTIRKQKELAPVLTEVLAALDYMVENPEAGRVRYTEGESYVFTDA